MTRRIGITTTIPVEAVYAAGAVPVDLNNIFIADPEARRLVERAERDGLPRNGCSWIKGIYGVVAADPKRFDAVVAVTEGDCSNTAILAEILERRGAQIIRFAYPPDRSAERLADEIAGLCAALGATEAEADAWKVCLDAIRARLHCLDRLTWQRGTITPKDNHLWLVSASDFGGEPEAFAERLNAAIARAEAAPPGGALQPGAVRLGFAGVPPIFTDLYETLESMGAYVVFNETQRQFALPEGGASLAEAYRRYTYPYNVAGRVADIRREIGRRGLHGIVHYAQTFCHRALADVIMREELGVPVLTIEGHTPGPLEPSARVRLESFVEMLR